VYAAVAEALTPVGAVEADRDNEDEVLVLEPTEFTAATL
jgi:hypothetical protein